MEKASWIWMDGELIPWEKAQVHLLTHSLHYGLGVFEGIRCYRQHNGSVAIFRHQEHINRLFESAQIALINVPFSREDVQLACKKVVEKNNFNQGCYLRPLVFVGAGSMGIAAKGNPIHVAIAGWQWGAYLGEEGIRNGIRTMISSYRRPQQDTSMVKAKLCGQYATSILAKREAINNGFDEAILLDTQGAACEGTGENLFYVKQGVVFTPNTDSAILEGITRDTVLVLLRDMKIPIREESFSRDKLYAADEVFMTGTAAEITPVREIDFRIIGTGKPGPITEMLKSSYAKLVRGKLKQYQQFLDVVEL